MSGIVLNVTSTAPQLLSRPKHTTACWRLAKYKPARNPRVHERGVYDVRPASRKCTIPDRRHGSYRGDALHVLESRQQGDGRRLLDGAHDETLALSFGESVGEPSRWNRLRALTVLRRHPRELPNRRVLGRETGPRRASALLARSASWRIDLSSARARSCGPSSAYSRRRSSKTK
jgi:hypothetical protein